MYFDLIDDAFTTGKHVIDLDVCFCFGLMELLC
jgi:hypothetical protein